MQWHRKQPIYYSDTFQNYSGVTVYLGFLGRSCSKDDTYSLFALHKSATKGQHENSVCGNLGPPQLFILPFPIVISFPVFGKKDLVKAGLSDIIHETIGMKIEDYSQIRFNGSNFQGLVHQKLNQ